MVFSLYLLLIPYCLFLLLWTVFGIIAVFHVLKFAFRGIVSALAVSVFIGVSAFLLAASYGYISRVDWEAEATVFGNISDFFSFFTIR